MSYKIKAIIIDDEPEARKGVEYLLSKDNEIEVISVCKNGIEAINDINELNPDLIFLDIQMPEVDGFDVLNSIRKDRNPVIIFITAYDQYALKAFKVNAVDYLLKPFSDEKFYNSVIRAKQFINNRSIDDIKSKVTNLLDFYSADENNEKVVNVQIPGKLIIKVDKKIKFLELKNIIYFEAYDYMLKIHTVNSIEVIRETLTKMKNRLPENQFIQTHRSYIVNLSFIKELEPYFNNEYIAKLTNGEVIKVSRNHKKNILNLI